MATIYEAVMARKKNIEKWLPEYISTHFSNPSSFGHMARKHVNISLSALEDRAVCSKYAASVFYDNQWAVAELLTNILLDEYNLDDIACWLADHQDLEDLLFTIDCGKAIGCGYQRSRTDVCETSTVMIVLKKRGSEFRCVTAYPLLES